MRNVFLIAAACLGLGPVAAVAAPTALVGGTIYPVAGEPIVDGTIVFDETGILAVGADVKLPEGATSVDCRGRRIYPSFIAADTALGLVEIPSVRATVDTGEAGQLNPNAVAHKAFNPDSELIPVTRSNGVLVALVCPSGGLIAGQSSLMALSGWTWEEMLIRPGVAMHVAWPRERTDRPRRPAAPGAEPSPPPESGLDRLSKLFDEVDRYAAARKADAGPETFDIRFEAMLPVVEGRQPLMVAADRAAEIESAVAFAADRKLKLILLGGYDAPACAALLKQHDVPVIVSAVLRLPLRRSDPYDAAYTLPERLRAAGVRYAIAGEGRTANTRNLPYHAATAAAYGLPRDEALRAVTLHVADILGVGDRLGSLEVGKQATLFLCDGDPLEATTTVTAAYVGGKAVDLSDKHKRLYERFRQRTEPTP